MRRCSRREPARTRAAVPAARVIRAEGATGEAPIEDRISPARQPSLLWNRSRADSGKLELICARHPATRS